MKARVLVLLLAVVFGGISEGMAQTSPDGVLTLDAAATADLPRSFRTSAFPFRVTDGPVPSRNGLDRLRISGSGEFSAGQLGTVLANLPGRVTIVDLRRESHGFLGDAAVSWVTPGNQGNPGLDAAAVAAAETTLLAGIDGKSDVPVVRIIKQGQPGEKKERETLAMGPASARTEAELAAALGAGSLRVPVSDRTRPDDAAVDRFLTFYRTVSPETWLHFHCRAGHGRTTTFMAMADMLKNANDVSFEDVIVRQWLLGGVDVREVSGKWERIEASQARLAFLRRFYDYARANPGARPLLWTQWLAGAGAR